MNNICGLLILSCILIFLSILISLVTSIIILCVRVPKKEYVYYLSKIATMKNIVKINHNSQIFDHFNSDGELEGITTKYIKLLNLTTNDGCKEGYKKCGILDTLGNVLCIDNNFGCPINKLTVDLLANKNKYLNQGLKEIYNENLIYNYKFYYSNESLDGNSIVSLLFSDEKPRYITLSNFVVDLAAYKDHYKDNLNNQNDDIEDRGINFGENLISIFVPDDYVEKLIKAAFSLISLIEDSDNDKEKFKDYVVKKLESEENKIDKYYLNVGENAYIKNYIGFKSLNDINRFMNFDYNIYKDKYPTYTAFILAIITIVAGGLSLVTSIFYYIALCCKYDFKSKKVEYNNNSTSNKCIKMEDKEHDNNRKENIINDDYNETQMGMNIDDFNKSNDLEDKDHNNSRKKNINNDNNNKTQMDKERDDSNKRYCDLIFCKCNLKSEKTYFFLAFLVLAFIVMNVILLIYSAVVLHRNHNTKNKLKKLNNIESDDFIQSFLIEFKRECKISSLIIPTIALLGSAVLIHLIGTFYMIALLINLK